VILNLLNLERLNTFKPILGFSQKRHFLGFLELNLINFADIGFFRNLPKHVNSVTTRKRHYYSIVTNNRGQIK